MDELKYERSTLLQFQRLEYRLNWFRYDPIFPSQYFLGSRSLNQMTLVLENSASARSDDVLSCSSRFEYEAIYRNSCDSIRRAASTRKLRVEFRWILPDEDDLCLPPTEAAI